MTYKNIERNSPRHPDRREGSPQSGKVLHTMRSLATIGMTWGVTDKEALKSHLPIRCLPLLQDTTPNQRPNGLFQPQQRERPVERIMMSQQM